LKEIAAAVESGEPGCGVTVTVGDIRVSARREQE
jgi:hypothetical protein